MPEQDNLEDIAKAYLTCFTTPAGQKVLAHLDRTYLDQSPTMRSNGVYYLPHEIQVRAAEQNPIKWIHEMIALPDLFMEQRRLEAEAEADNEPFDPDEIELFQPDTE